MKKQTNSNWQKQLLFAAIAAMVFMFAANSVAFAQATYKVGDRVEVQSAGKWFKAEILDVKGNGYYGIRFIDTGESLSWYPAEHIRPIKADAPTNNQNTAGNQVQNQTNGNTQTTNGGGTAATQQEQSIRERYGSRDPRTCEDQKAPARGAITAELAKKYFICKAEGVSGSLLYLVENLKLEVGGGIPYAAIIGHRSFSEIDVKHPVYPIRGSLLRYQCKDLVREHVGPPDTNCHTYNEPKATGYCYKTTFGDWSCYMSDSSNKPENERTGVAPPK